MAMKSMSRPTSRTVSARAWSARGSSAVRGRATRQLVRAEPADVAAAAAEMVTGASEAIAEESQNFVDSVEKQKTVLVAGATGGCGRQVVLELVKRGVPVVALVRDPQKAVDLGVLEGVEVVEADVFQMSTLPKAMAGCKSLVIATGASDISNPFGPFNVDFQGTLNLLAAAEREKVERIVLISSIGADDPFNPLNLFWGVLFWKKRAEEAVQRCGIPYTIVRPGGLKNKLKEGEVEGKIVMKGPNSYGVAPQKKSGSILRRQVAEVVVQALYEDAAVDKVVEVVADVSASELPLAAQFASL